MNRIWIFAAIKKHNISGKWLTNALIDVCEVEADVIASGQYKYVDNKIYMDELLDTLVQAGQRDRGVLVHFTKHRNGILRRSQHAKAMLVKYDSIIKELQQNSEEDLERQWKEHIDEIRQLQVE